MQISYCIHNAYDSNSYNVYYTIVLNTHIEWQKRRKEFLFIKKIVKKMRENNLLREL